MKVVRSYQQDRKVGLFLQIDSQVVRNRRTQRRIVTHLQFSVKRRDVRDGEVPQPTAHDASLSTFAHLMPVGEDQI